jgi:hypothetical protein
MCCPHEFFGFGVWEHMMLRPRLKDRSRVESAVGTAQGFALVFGSSHVLTAANRQKKAAMW